MQILTTVFEWVLGIGIVATLLYVLIATTLDLLYQRCDTENWEEETE